MRTRHSVQNLLLASALAVVVGGPAHGNPVVTIPPSGDLTGQTDYENLQFALEDAVPGTEILLEAGTYYVNYPIAVTNFRGTLCGAGQEATIVTTVGEMPSWINGDDPPWLNPPSVDNPWPVLLSFVDSQLTLTDMTFQITEYLPCRFEMFGMEFEVLAGIIYMVDGDTGGATGSSIRRVGFEGSAGTYAGHNLVQAVYPNGLVAEAGGAWGYPLHGMHQIRQCTFETMYAGIAVYHMAEDATLIAKDNTFSNVTEGLEVYDTSGRIMFSHNEVTSHPSEFGGDGSGVLFIQGLYPVLEGLPVLAPAKLSVFNNTINDGSGFAAMDIEDWQFAFLGAPPSVEFGAWGNEIVADGAVYGIYGFGLNGPRAIMNQLDGAVLDAGIQLEMTADGWCFLNDVQGVQAGTAPFVLAADTEGNLVVAEDAWNNVLDLTDDPTTPEYDGANTIISVGPVGFQHDD